jgi:hypothetical protein
MTDQLLFNLLVALLRFGNVFFLVCVPLISVKNKELLTATPLVGYSSLIVIFFVLLSNRFVNFLIRAIQKNLHRDEKAKCVETP